MSGSAVQVPRGPEGVGYSKAEYPATFADMPVGTHFTTPAIPKCEFRKGVGNVGECVTPGKAFKSQMFHGNAPVFPINWVKPEPRLEDEDEAGEGEGDSDSGSTVNAGAERSPELSDFLNSPAGKRATGRDKASEGVVGKDLNRTVVTRGGMQPIAPAAAAPAGDDWGA